MVKKQLIEESELNDRLEWVMKNGTFKFLQRVLLPLLKAGLTRRQTKLRIVKLSDTLGFKRK